MKVCSICGKPIENEDAPILTISGFGNARYLCDECADEMDLSMSSRDIEEIEATVSKLGKKMENCRDEQAQAELYRFIKIACERLSRIKEGKYDFAVDERLKEIADAEGIEEIPEELRETEEDKALDAEEAKKQEKFDKIMNWITIGAIVVTAIIIIARIIG